MAVFPGTGSMASLCHAVAIWGFAIPATAGLATSLATALIRRA